MNQKVILGSLLALTLAACSSDDSNSPSTTPDEPKRTISVEVSENPFPWSEGSREDTRGTIIRTSTLGGFNMHYQENNYAVTKSGSNWNVSPDTWPSSVANNTNITFYAHSGSTYNYNNGTPYISHSVDQNVSSQHDLLVAQTTTNYNDKQGKVYFTFDHACAGIEFNVALTNNVVGRVTAINSIKLRNIPDQGDYSYSAGWQNIRYSNIENPTYYTLNSGALSPSTDWLALSGGTLFMIPQTLSAWSSSNTSGAYIEVNLQLGANESKTGIIPLGMTWEAGQLYPVDIVIGTSLKDVEGQKIFN